jgi:hypothetical protein
LMGPHARNEAFARCPPRRPHERAEGQARSARPRVQAKADSCSSRVADPARRPWRGWSGLLALSIW